jgi:hypothetical protein
MSPEKKRAAKKHFLEPESGFNRLLAAAKNDIPSEETIEAIHDYNIRSGKMDLSKAFAEVPRTAAFYLNFLLQAERKSIAEVAQELKVTSLDLKHLQKETTPIKEKSLFEFCGSFIDKHSQFELRPLFRLLKRSIVLHEMASGVMSVKKAGRKKK